MTQYIDKDALVAKIIEHIKTYNKGYANGDDRRTEALENLLHDLNTLEVKEVDLEKEVNAYMVNEMKFLSDEVGYDTLLAIAKHFFELGMSVSNKAQKGE